MSRIRRHSRLPRPRHAAFTLIEVLLVVALLGFVSFVFVNGVGDLFRTKEPRADDIFWQAVTASRQLALEKDQAVILRYDDEKKLLAWSSVASTTAAPAQSLAYPGRSLEFLPVVQQGSILLGGQLTETDGIKFIKFYPDGACDAFRAQIVDQAGRRSVTAIDQWTCAPMLTAPAQ